jgi:2,4-dienoyl-CoA reductase-like NADH-dependent reductase (Old Yellow Enzyme family)
MPLWRNGGTKGQRPPWFPPVCGEPSPQQTILISAEKTNSLKHVCDHLAKTYIKGILQAYADAAQAANNCNKWLKSFRYGNNV